MTPEEQANGLTEAALEETLGGPFHPGCEFTWPMRHAMMYDKKMPFRIKRRRRVKDDFGVAINPAITLAPGGPLDGSSPGDITRWMAVPWQSDTSSCLSAYKAYAGEYLPTFWPARVPNDVFTEEDYKKIRSKKASKEDKIAAFGSANRKKWLRGYIYNDDGSFRRGLRNAGITKFTEEWGKIGIILEKASGADPNLFPEKVWVETGRDPSLDTSKKVSSRGLSRSASKKQEDKDVASERPAWVDMNPRKLR